MMIGLVPAARRAFFRRLPLLIPLAVLAIADQTPAATREIAIAPGVDYFGRDYSTLKSVSLDACKSACRDDSRCQAFTYNVKAEWCFLKETFTEIRPFDGAISGRIVESATAAPDLAATRTAELRFLPPRELTEARALVERIARMEPQTGRRNALIKEARAATGAKAHQKAADLYAAALRLNPDDGGLWQNLAEAALAAQPSDWQIQQRLKQDATAAAINAYLRGDGDAAARSPARPHRPHASQSAGMAPGDPRHPRLACPGRIQQRAPGL